MSLGENVQIELTSSADNVPSYQSNRLSYLFTPVLYPTNTTLSRCNSIKLWLPHLDTLIKNRAMEEFREKFGERLRELRNQKGISQEILSEKAGFHRTYVYKLENSKIEPKLNSLKRIADALDVPVMELFRFEEE